MIEQSKRAEMDEKKRKPDEEVQRQVEKEIKAGSASGLGASRSWK